MKKFFRILLVSLIGIAALAFAAFYFLIYEADPVRFPAHTTINSIDVSGLTEEAAEERINEHMKEETFSLEYQGKTYDISLGSLDFEASLGPVFSELGLFAQLKGCIGIGNSFEAEVQPQDSDEFTEMISALPFCDNTGRKASTDAYIDMSDFDFRVVKETIGTEIDPARIIDIILESIRSGEFSAGMTPDEIVALPAVTEDSEGFKERLKYCRDNLSFRLDYNINGSDYLLTPDKLDKMVSYGQNGADIDSDAVYDLITQFASQCNEYNENYSFRTHGGRNITVTGVNFGKYLDKDGMAEELKQALKDQKSKTMDLKWGQVKYSDGAGIGSSYIEVSIKNQHLWCYKNGKMVVDCDCVTGVPGHDTSRGVFVVQYVTGPTTLRGSNDDGSTYESPVNCFIPFYGDQGFHGSNGWRSKWGGNIYKTAGSHGCVNCPDAAARKLADSVGPGYPVVIY